MKKYKKEQTVIDVLDDVICDSCGKSCYNGWEFGYTEVQHSYGYGSELDGTIFKADICDKCFESKFLPLANFNITKYIP
jgi:hypothetical protein